LTHRPVGPLHFMFKLLQTNFFSFSFFFFSVLGLKPRASHVPGKQSTTELHPKSCLLLYYCAHWGPKHILCVLVHFHFFFAYWYLKRPLCLFKSTVSPMTSS
jgi:hypothetical protein